VKVKNQTTNRVYFYSLKEFKQNTVISIQT